MTTEEFWTSERNLASLVARVATSSFTDATRLTWTSSTIATAMNAAALSVLRAPVCEMKMMQATPMMSAGTLPSGSVARIRAAGLPRSMSGCAGRFGRSPMNVLRRASRIPLVGRRFDDEGGKRGMLGVKRVPRTRADQAWCEPNNTQVCAPTRRACTQRRAGVEVVTRRDIWFGVYSVLYWSGSKAHLLTPHR